MHFRRASAPREHPRRGRVGRFSPGGEGGCPAETIALPAGALAPMFRGTASCYSGKNLGKTCTIKENDVTLQQQIPPRFPFEQRTRAELRFFIWYGLHKAGS